MTALAWLAAAGFDPDAYIADNPGLAAKGLTASRATEHFLRHGYAEARNLRLQKLPHTLALFDTECEPDRERCAMICQRVYAVQSRMPESADYLWSGDTAVLDDFFLRTGAAPFFVIGDSHSHAYRRYGTAGRTWWAPVPLLCTAGSAMGLTRPSSRTGYGPKILRWAERNSSGAGQRYPVLVKFGQVDIEFVWNFRRIRDKAVAFSRSAFDGFAEQVLAEYFAFLDALASRIGSARLHVCSIFPPALNDASWKEGYVNGHVGQLEGDRSLEALAEGVRTLEIPDQVTRTQMHAAFNTGLREGCLVRGLGFIDDFHPLLGPDGILDQRYVPLTAGRDHHVGYWAVADPINALLREVLRDTSKLPTG